MSDKTHIVTFLIIFGSFVVLASASNFVRYYTLKDYEVYVFADCNPAIHSCFITDPSYDGFSFLDTPYVKVEIRAHDAPSCLDEHTCTDFTCTGHGESCSVTYCSRETLEGGEVCISPKY